MNQSSLLKEIREQIRYFLRNPIYIGSLIIAAILGYGYVLTHGTCGIDDISIDLYFENGIGVAIGRWPYYLVNKVIPIAEYTPFIGDFITVILLMLSAVVLCVAVRMLVEREISIWAYVVFVVFFLDYSMNADVFVFYLQNGLGWVYLFSALSLVCFFYLYSNEVSLKQQVIIRTTMIIMLTLAISFYESAASVFLTGGLMIIFVNLYLKKSDSVFRGIRYIGALFFIARYLVYTMVARRLIRAVLMRVFSIPAYVFYRSAASLEWLTKGSIEDKLEAIQTLLAQIYRDYFAMAVVHYPILLFVICSVGFLLVVLYCTKKNKDVILLLTGIGIYGSMFAISFIECMVMPYRTCQIFNVFVAAMFFVLAAIIEKKKKIWKRMTAVVIALCFAISIKDMISWFQLDYDKTEYEMWVIDDIANDLNSGKYNIQEKPIIIVGDFQLPDYLYKKYCIEDGDFGWEMVKKAAVQSGVKVSDYYCYGQNNSSILNWAVTSFAMECGYNVSIRQLFEYRGYRFDWADGAIADRVFEEYFPMDWEYFSYSNTTIYTQNYKETEQYPNENYIEELEDCIVIKL